MVQKERDLVLIGYISAADSVGIFIQIFQVGSKRCMFHTIKYIIGVQCHPRSLISVPIESTRATSYYTVSQKKRPNFETV